VADQARRGFTFTDDTDSLPGQLLDLLIRSRPRWQADALCREHPEVSFFPEKGQPAGPAKRVCQECLVFADCRRWALEQGPDLEGVWGGMTPRERRTVRMGRTGQAA
jgi:WhiB family redox-sensing transcriptional regulator